MHLLLCPFCSSSEIDAESRLDHPGPTCEKCGGSANTIELWNSRPNPAMNRLVLAARCVAFGDQSAEAIRELDRASEAFASLVPWEEEPEGTGHVGRGPSPTLARRFRK